MRALNTIKIIFRTRTKENVDDKSSFLSLSLLFVFLILFFIFSLRYVFVRVY